MRPAKVLALLSVILALSVLFVIPAAASSGDVTSGDVGLVPYDSSIKVSAGSTESFNVEVVNYLSYTENDITNSRMVSVTTVSPSGISVSVDDDSRSFVLEGQQHQTVALTVSADKYAAAGKYDVGIILNITSLSGGTTVATDPAHVTLIVQSPLSSGNSYNKIMGFFNNPLPDPLNGPLASAVITFILWMIIGAAIMIIAMPLLLRVFSIGREEAGEKIKKGLRTILLLVVFLFAFDSGLRVYGTAEEIIGPVEVLFDIFYIALGAVIVWRVYLILIQHMISRISKSHRIDQREMDLEPLLRLFGKLVIWVLAVTMIMSVWGFNLTAIITSAGIISLGITLGAQNILNQFFSGMVLLLTRPFKSGDLVKIGNNTTTIYKVSSVNIMNTVFENWDNEETVIMPNNAVSSSTIVNLTGDGLMYKITVFMNIAYEDDVDTAKEIMKKAAMDHPSVITNGTVSLPSTRVTSFLDSSIEVRLTAYVYDFNDNGRICGELRETIFKAFKEKGISIPFPQRDVNIKVVNKKDLQKDSDD